MIRSDMPELPHCHVPATFDPENERAVASEVRRLIGAAEWLSRELEEKRGCHAALIQVAVLQADLDSIASRLVDGHLRYCVTQAVTERHSAEEVHALLVPVQSLMFARR